MKKSLGGGNTPNLYYYNSIITNQINTFWAIVFKKVGMWFL